MNQKTSKQKWTVPVLVFLLFFAGILSFNLGVVTITPSEIWQTLLGNGSPKQNLVLFDIRLPSLILAIFVGAAMAISGTILQSITQNELAEPGILGINSGAGLAVVLYITFFQSTTSGISTLNTYILPGFAFIGALITAGLIILFAWKGGFHSIRLVLVGIGINAGLGAILVALQLKLNPIDFMQAVVWLSGDLWATQWRYVWALIPWFVVLIPYTMYKAHTLNILNLGSQLSTGLGIQGNRERLILMILAVAMAGLGVSAGGGIAFLGLIAPHIARRLVGPRHQIMLPVAALLGSFILLLADTIGKNIISPIELPAGIVVSLVSAPYFIYLLMKSR